MNIETHNSFLKKKGEYNDEPNNYWSATKWIAKEAGFKSLKSY